MMCPNGAPFASSGRHGVLVTAQGPTVLKRFMPTQFIWHHRLYILHKF
jgi:hypothetical protein